MVASGLGLAEGTGRAVLPAENESGTGGVTGTAKAICSRAGAAFGVLRPTFDGGTRFDGTAIDPVVSGEGAGAVTCSELERDVQPEASRHIERIAEKANKRIKAPVRRTFAHDDAGPYEPRATNR